MIKFWWRFGVRTGALLTVLLAVTLTSGQLAHGASHVVKDPKRDTYRPGGVDGATLISNPRSNGDITSVRTVHRAKAVDVVIKARKLRRGFNVVVIEIMTSAKHRPNFYLTAVIPSRGHQDVYLTKRLEQTVTCHGLKVRQHVARGVVRAHIPRHCLDNPRWIRSGASLFMSPGNAPADWTSIDVAGKKVLTSRWWRGPARIPMSPRIPAGH